MDESSIKSLEVIRQAAERVNHRVTVMEVCGTHTVSIFRHGLRDLLPPNVRLVSGPGCPVCVTAQSDIDAAIELADRDDVVIATYGDMVRVPGKCGSFEQKRAGGAAIRVIGSTRAALDIARRRPDRQIVFLAVGFETTAPATAAAILEAERCGIDNFSVLGAHKLVVPAMQALLQDGGVSLDGFLGPGHVSVIIGSKAYEPTVERYGIPCVIAGFEPASILSALARLLRQIQKREYRVENAYRLAVSWRGNEVAQRLIDDVFQVVDVPWRALGEIPQSGLALKPTYRRFDAAQRFEISVGDDEDHPACLCGQVIQGKVEPPECSLFGTSCTPMTPFGPCMVSSEGTCSAWFKYHRPPATSDRAEGSVHPCR